ncbi:response regulator transcription factor [Rhodococcus sp. NPDC059968]|uniref:response regulator transcription factor n=1 Tax=Rhodococcus sp. NPDC059968 TaxID=3347017 RepID=UPI00366C0BE9
MNSPTDHRAVPATVLVAAPDFESPFIARLRAADLNVKTGQAVPIQLSADSPDVVVLDARSPAVDGLRIVRALRAAESVPGIVVMGQFSPRDDNHTCAYFEAGVDDVIGDPVCAEEAVARVRALLRRIRASRAPTQPTTFGAISLSIVCTTVQMQDVRIPLTRTETNLLVVLAKNADRVVSRGQLLPTVWGLPTEAKNNVLNTCIYTLRRKLDSHGAPHLIHTVRGLGFSLRTR